MFGFCFVFFFCLGIIFFLCNLQWKENKPEIENQGTQILDALMRGLQASDEGSSGVPSLEVSDKGYQMLKKSFDKEHGGFGSAPKFPQPGEILLHSFFVYHK